MRTKDFDYSLPPELIAQYPSAARGESRLLVVDRQTGSFADHRFAELDRLIQTGDLLVLNETKVRHARFLGHRPSGGAAEVLLLRPEPDGTWIAMGRPGSALKPGGRVLLGDGAAIETVEQLDGPTRRIRFVGIDAAAAMARFGRLPLPPYIDRDPTLLDDDRYQTVFADKEGSVAAPTAGLHFTPDLLNRLEERGIALAKIDLEVGAGTFRPVEAENPENHVMDLERFTIPSGVTEAIEAARARGNRVWAVGTTVVRALESAADDDGVVTPGKSETRLLILPGYRFKAVDGLITNFHLPRSTLIMLVAAFAGRDLIMRAYRHAIESGYRFYSYGDAMLIR